MLLFDATAMIDLFFVCGSLYRRFFNVGFHMEHGCMGLWSWNYIIVPVTSLGAGCSSKWRGVRGSCRHHATL